MIISQAVMEHVDDLDSTYKAMHFWLKPGGIMSHQIDFKSHRTSKKWNGHWTYSDFEWKMIKGRNVYLINRKPVSTHLELLKKNGFEIISSSTTNDYPTQKYVGAIDRSELYSKFRDLSDLDFNTCSAHIVSRKR